jgi:dTDP-4-dehydrorhamnose 3,5-epimerase
MKVIDTTIAEVEIIEPAVLGDKRGFFMETWNQTKFEELVTGKPTLFVQDNHSKSKKWILCGLHFQTENTQGKLLRVVSGEVFDIRKGSLTFGKWVGEYLEAENKRLLWILEGFAHRFYVANDEAEFVYKYTNYYHPKSEISLAWKNDDIGIEWPCVYSPILSFKEFNAISLKKLKLNYYVR